MIFAMFKNNQLLRMRRVYESLDDLAYKVFQEFIAGNIDKAADLFRTAPAERQAYLSYTLVGTYMANSTIDNSGKYPALSDLNEFFKFVIR